MTTSAPALKYVRTIAFAFGLAAAWTPAGAALAAPAPSTLEPGAPGAATAPPPPDDEAGYAEREKTASPKLGEFAGGDVVVITTTTLLIVALVVLVVILL